MNRGSTLEELIVGLLPGRGEREFCVLADFSFPKPGQALGFRL